jgi:hypothetical protein
MINSTFKKDFQASKEAFRPMFRILNLDPGFFDESGSGYRKRTFSTSKHETFELFSFFLWLSFAFLDSASDLKA